MKHHRYHIPVLSIFLAIFIIIPANSVAKNIKMIKIVFSNYSIEAEIYDTPTGRAIYEALPLKSRVKTWGDEIYFEIPVHVFLQKDSTADVAVGDLAYWPLGPAFCIFFGPTPASSGSQPKAADAVNIFGKVIHVNVKALRTIKKNELVIVEKTK